MSHLSGDESCDGKNDPLKTVEAAIIIAREQHAEQPSAGDVERPMEQQDRSGVPHEKREERDQRPNERRGRPAGPTAEAQIEVGDEAVDRDDGATPPEGSWLRSSEGGAG